MTEPSTEVTEPETQVTTPSTEATAPTKPGDSTNAGTGDTSGIVTVMVIMLVSLTGLAVLLLLGKKRNQE